MNFKIGKTTTPSELFSRKLMTKSKTYMNHTPGPWLVEQVNPFSSLIYTLNYKGYEGKKVSILEISENGDECAVVSNEDAHLISAAPCMYEALKDMQRVIRYLYLLEGLAYKVDKAIKKAEGKLK